MAGWLDGGLSARDVYIFAAFYWSARESLHVHVSSLGLWMWFCSCGERSCGWRRRGDKDGSVEGDRVSGALVRKVHNRAFCIPALITQ